jgi:hypothetical protein
MGLRASKPKATNTITQQNETNVAITINSTVKKQQKEGN